MSINKESLIAELCSNIATVKDLDKFLLCESTSKIFSDIFNKLFIITKDNSKIKTNFSTIAIGVASFSFYIENVFIIEDLGESRAIFESIAEIIKKREDDFRDDLTKMLNMQGFIQSLINSSLEHQNSKASFLALKIDTKDDSILESKAIIGIANRLKKISLGNWDVISRWSYNVFCLFIMPDNTYSRVLEIEKALRESLSDLDLTISIGIHRLPNTLLHFEVSENLKDKQILEVLESSSFKELIAKTFKAMGKAMDKTFIVGTKVYKDLRTKEFIKAQSIPTEFLVKRGIDIKSKTLYNYSNF